MDEKEFKALQATMPWKHVTVRQGRGTRIVILNNKGEEVDLIAMVRFLEVISAKLAIKPPAEEKSNA